MKENKAETLRHYVFQFIRMSELRKGKPESEQRGGIVHRYKES